MLLSKHHLVTNPNNFEMYSKLSKLGNIMRTEILNSGIKDGLKIVSKTKMKNCWSTVYQEIYSTWVTQ